MVQNTKGLLYHSIVLPLHFPISFYITQHPYWLQNIFYN